MSLEEFKSYVAVAGFARKCVAVDEIAGKVAQGARLELVESTFADVGPDFTEVRLDGNVILHVPGY
jgi:hypothetical protein